jgi:putative DNA methylase
MPAFIETQFPIARLSAEAYKERKAGASQTLTGLGKWWGRKPLILVRASILGMLMPASNDAKKDREIFLKILTMDDDGTWERCKPAVRKKLSRAEFDSRSYAERIADCERPENVSGPSTKAWTEINDHLGTSAQCLTELVEQLGKRAFGHTPRVGDSFCGGGSIPFEAARIGCDAFGSDLNPVAGLLTWASLNLLGGGEAVQDAVRKMQQAAFAATNKQIYKWGIDRNNRGENAEAFLYCVEVKPEGCEYYIPLAPSWVISEKYRIVVTWAKVTGSDRLEPTVMPVTETELKLFKEKKGATVIDGRVVDPFDENHSWSIEALRGTEGLRRWTNEDFVSRPGDIFQERLYCIRWVDAHGTRRYAAPDADDIAREARVLALLRERFAEWQREGFIPSLAIPASGAETDRLFRERGWTHWHHLFTPRQLLMHGVLMEKASHLARTQEERAYTLLSIGYICDNSSRLCGWNPHHSKGPGNTRNVFSNQALNTLVSFGTKSFSEIQFSVFDNSFSFPKVRGHSEVLIKDARDITTNCDYWITDPPYADAVNYHELADFFLAWYEKSLATAFPSWIPDSRSELAVRGDGDEFRHSMVDVYQNLARHMPDNGMQMVMFTHQNPAVWADLGMILWAAGLKATAAWTISTETEAAGIKKGNYVQGTVCLVLRKRTSLAAGFLDEIYPLVEDEVRRQIESMQSLDEGGEPNFNDSDYQLAAYAAALKVLTQYGSIDGRDVEHEVFAKREKGHVSDFQAVIERALGIACNVLIPKGLDSVWRDLTLVERYYLRALDIESRGERRNGMYEELARGFGVTDIKPLLKSDKANGARMYTPSGLAGANLAPIGSAGEANVPIKRGRGSSAAPHPFASSSLRHLLFAIRETTAADNSPDLGRQYLRDTFGQAYWGLRERFVALLEWFTELGNAADMPEWAEDAEAARILAGRLRNDHA